MERTPTKAVSGRVSVDLAAQLEDASNETGRTKSELVAIAVTNYIEENPDDLRSFYPDDPFAAFVEELC